MFVNVSWMRHDTWRNPRPLCFTCFRDGSTPSTTLSFIHPVYSLYLLYDLTLLTIPLCYFVIFLWIKQRITPPIQILQYKSPVPSEWFHHRKPIYWTFVVPSLNLSTDSFLVRSISRVFHVLWLSKDFLLTVPGKYKVVLVKPTTKVLSDFLPFPSSSHGSARR